MQKIRIPYGTANFYRLITEGNYYVDRTAYIRTLEEKGDTLLFLRPRRFGKSLLLSMLENYYDVNKTAEFERLFGHLDIGKNPTPHHNQYLILRWDFSTVDPQGTSDAIRQSLYDSINGSIETFKVHYDKILHHPIELYPTNGIRTFQSLLAAIQTTHYPLYLLVDEYDNFANEVLMAAQSGSEQRYQQLVEGEGIIKTVFKNVKSALGGQGLERVFMAGVSPVLANDLTSGFNVVKNITGEPDLHALCGFTKDEVMTMLTHVTAVCNLTPLQQDEAMMMMQTYYNGYRFSFDEDIRLYNPMLVLYFLRYFQDHCRYPRKMLDDNLAADRQKIRYVSRLPHGEQVITAALSDVAPPVVADLADRFGVYDVLYGEKDDPFMASLLYYLGVLTLGDITPFGKRQLTIPNLVTRKLYAEQIQQMLLPPGSNNEVLRVVETLCNQGNIGAVCEFIEQKIFATLDNRDYQWANELTVKMAFLTLLFNDIFYIMDSEPALQRQYADLVMIVRPDMRQYQLYDILIECKYIGLKELKMSGADVQAQPRDVLAALPLVVAAQTQAREQLMRYRQTLAATYGERLTLRCFSVVALGYERIVWDAV